MSGGAFDYRQRYIEDIADEIEQEIADFGDDHPGISAITTHLS